MPELQLVFLGVPAISVDGRLRSDHLPQKPQALVYYLARQAGPRMRSQVAGLLWPDVDERAARANLRVALSRLRKTVGDCFAATRETVALDPAWTATDDVTPFLEAVAGERWAEAAKLYRGPFLDGLELIDASPFSEWLIVERERLHQLGVRALERALQQALDESAWERADQHARQLLVLDPWREVAHRGLIHALAASGQRAAALAQYERCRAELAAELDIEPAPATVALYEAVRAAAPGTPFAAQPAAAVPQHRPVNPLPPQPHDLVGRRAELDLLTGRLLRADGRLVTISGLGGSGKTRLALAVAGTLADRPDSPFDDGVAWIPLAGVTDGQGLVNAVAAATGLTFSGGAPPREQLFSYLRFKQMLLVADNMEQLADEAPLLADLLQAAPGLRLLVTSRERLNLYAEWHYPLPGLPYDGPASPAHDLFVARASRTHNQFDAEGERTGILAICRLVEGLPLGIELAASWVHAFTCEEIAAALRDQQDTLAARTRDVPARHRSLEAAFEYSWQLLKEDEREALMALAVMPGSFSLDGAQRVGGADRRRLAGLVEKSMIRRSGRRYEIHQLLRQFAWQKLPQAQRTMAGGRLVAYVSGFLQAWAPAVTTPDQDEALRAIALEQANIRRAWQLAIDLRQPAALAHMIPPLAHYFLKRGQQHLGVRLLAPAVTYVETLGPTREPLLAELLTWQGRCAELISDSYDVPDALLARGGALAEQHGLPALVSQSCLGRGLLQLFQGRYEDAEAQLRQGLAAAARAETSWAAAGLLATLAWLRSAAGDTDEAIALCHQALALQRAAGDSNGMAATLTTYGIVLTSAGRLPEAEKAYREALTLSEKNRHLVGRSQALTGLMGLLLRQSRFTDARRYGEESLAVSRDVGNRLGMAIAHHNLGYAAAGEEDHAAAVAHYQQALAIYAELAGDPARIVNTRRYLAESLLAQGETAAAREALCQALALLTPALTERFGKGLLVVGERLLNSSARDSSDPPETVIALHTALGCAAEETPS